MEKSKRLRQSTNIEDRTKYDNQQKYQLAKQTEKGRYNDVLKEPTPIAKQRNLERGINPAEMGEFDPRRVAFKLTTKASGFKDPEPQFLKHTIKNHL